MIAQKGFVRTIKVDEPALSNNTADVQRVEDAIKKEIRADRVRFPLELLQGLPSKLRNWQHRMKVVLFRDCHSWFLVDLLPPDDADPVLGAAIDIGTTRVIINLVDLESGEILGEIGFDNPQKQIGPDVLARIHHSNRAGGLMQLQTLIIDGVNTQLALLCRDHGYSKDQVYLVTGAGNTAMTHLFAGIEAFQIIKEPYIPCVNILDTLSCAELGLQVNPKAPLFLFPNIGSYFGGDLIAGILFADLDQKDKPTIMVDVGTNAEIVVGSRDWLIACAGAAGPALESGVSRMGMTAKPGVIDRVWVNQATNALEFHTIDDQPAKGICGSGMIDLAAALFLSGRVDIRGKFVPSVCGNRLLQKDEIDHFILVDDHESGTREPICLSQVDLNSLTSAKAAMHTILEVIVNKTAGLGFEDLDRFYVAGTFGSFIDPESAIAIGMLPDIPVDTFEVLGNSSLGGATLLLKDPNAFDRIMQIRQSITYIELNVNQEFMNLFSGAKFYPHTDRSRFPSLEDKIQRAEEVQLSTLKGLKNGDPV